MAYVITDECVSCGTCAGECPVEAIAEGDSHKSTSRFINKSIYNFISTDFLPLYSLVMPSYAPI